MASPFSFHCMICFEEFDVERRYPVVLPCGHTYVCNQCAERLDKCMECRTSLVQIVPRAPVGDTVYSGRGGGRWSSRPSGVVSPGGPPQPPIKKRLPLPKNVVLMSLIEATELAAEGVRSQERSSMDEYSHLNMPDAIVDIDEQEEENIRTGTSLAISECGTYAVAAKDGLEIYPSRPTSINSDENEQGADEEVDTLVRFSNVDRKLGISQSLSDEDDRREELLREKLRWGDRVQIVYIEAGWAKLARGYGYVRADKNHLVKVGSSVDRACKLEALLRLLSTRRKELRSEQKRVDNQFISLMNELQVSLLSDEDLTVIVADTFKNKRSSSGMIEEIKMDSIDLEQPWSQEIPVDDKYDEDSTPLKPRPMERPMTPPHTVESSRGFFCTGGNMFDAVIPMSSGVSSRPNTSLPLATSNAAVIEHYGQSHSNISRSVGELTPPPRLFASPSNPSPGALRAGARAWREIHGRPNGDAVGGVDFRTGMSGHTALNRTASSHPHDYLIPRGGTADFRGGFSGTVDFRGGFSNHSGLTMWKKKSAAKGPSSANMHLTMPMFPGPEPTA